jgi:plastocyanin
MRRAAALAVLSLLLVLPGAGDAADGDVRGRVELGVEGLALASVAPVVVYLERLDGRAGPPPTRAATMNQRDARFSPSFLVVAAGQPLHMANDDVIYHNVFSYSRPNDFDLGTYPAGESRTVTFLHPGVVRTYCSIHENMNGTIVVAPSRHYDVVDGSGRFLIGGVAAGRYRLHVWTEKLPPVARDITVSAGVDVEFELPLIDT